MQGGIAAETRQTLENTKPILAEADATLDEAVASTIHMVDLAEFAGMNKVYADYFTVMPASVKVVLSSHQSGPPQALFWRGSAARPETCSL